MFWTMLTIKPTGHKLLQIIKKTPTTLMMLTFRLARSSRFRTGFLINLPQRAVPLLLVTFFSITYVVAERKCMT